jgi:hypothetical protein
MSSSPSFCGICDIRHISKQSEVWCPDCEEGLCTECIEHHSLVKLSRGHTTIIRPVVNASVLTFFIIFMYLRFPKYICIIKILHLRTYVTLAGICYLVFLLPKGLNYLASNHLTFTRPDEGYSRN